MNVLCIEGEMSGVGWGRNTLYSKRDDRGGLGCMYCVQEDGLGGGEGTGVLCTDQG